MSDATSPFASTSVRIHLARGAGPTLCIAVALVLSRATGVPGGLRALGAFAFVAGAMVLLRGCPMCWTIGFFQTVARRMNKQRNAGSSPRKLY